MYYLVELNIEKLIKRIRLSMLPILGILSLLASRNNSIINFLMIEITTNGMSSGLTTQYRLISLPECNIIKKSTISQLWHNSQEKHS